MSGLKDYSILDIEAIDDERFKKEKAPGKWMPESRVYLKSEADKVIEELQEKLKVQTSIAEEGWKESSVYHTSYAEAVKELYEKNKELRHQKYKRSLDNAWWCRKLSNVYALIAYTHRGWKIARYYDEKAELYRKWRKRWIKIAGQFKEAK